MSLYKTQYDKPHNLNGHKNTYKFNVSQRLVLNTHFHRLIHNL